MRRPASRRAFLFVRATIVWRTKACQRASSRPAPAKTRSQVRLTRLLAASKAPFRRRFTHRASNNVPDHRFFTIGALYFLDIDRQTNAADAGISRLRREFAVRLQYGPTGRQGARRKQLDKLSGKNAPPRPRIASQRAAGTKYASGASEERFPEEFGPAAALRRHRQCTVVPASAQFDARAARAKRGQSHCGQHPSAGKMCQFCLTH